MPVLETLGGALFGAVLQVLLDKIDSHQVLDYFRGRNLNEKLLKELKRKLVSINAVVDDAEQKQFSNSYVKAWLDDVRDVLLDAEDLLDEIDYEFSKCKLVAEFQTSASKVCNFESRMIEVLDDLNSLSNQKGDLGLKTASGFGTGSGSGRKVTQKLPSTSLVAEDVIYGRDDDKEMILNWLMSDTDNHDQLSVLSIVGMGGMGKTTLAQHVYNDPRMEMKEANFDIKAWICVSDEFEVFKVTRTILEAIINSTDDSRNLEMVQGRLKDKLIGRRFLLVLDDVWNEDRDQWKALQTPLKYGAKGSKILVTTRSNKVAYTIQSNKIHELKQLQEDHSWQIFAKHAFKDDNLELSTELKDIGIKIVGKCKGLPLALEAIGCLLHTKSSVLEWESVLISQIWYFPEKDSKIIPALLLSYYHLPSHLKRCFAYCALFPKDHRFNKESLILLWMAENFLHCPQQSKSPEEVGEQYFEDLLSRSFFQLSTSTYEMFFVMHDLLNDLAKYVTGDICFRMGVDKPKGIPQIRHFSFSIDDYQDFDGFESLPYAKRLRTFMPTNRNTLFNNDWKKLKIHDLFTKFKFLRVLSLFWCDKLREVPNSLGDLKLLRSLDLSNTEIERLPDSTCSLYNLQTLKLNHCHNFQELPSNLYKLTNLRRLELIRTNLRKLPMHLGKLKNLQILMSSFEVGKSSESSIQQLGELSLHGELSIEELQNILNPLDALEADLKKKTNLVELALKWSRDRNLNDSMTDREVLESLKPSKHLKQLSILRYGGTRFPSWLFDNSLSNVVSLCFVDCKYCLCLPPLGILPFLKDLSITRLDGIVVVDADFYGSSSVTFPSLEKLEFSGMKEWEEWKCKDVMSSFPRLQLLSITGCPKLKGHLPEKLCRLQSITISECKQLVASVPRAPEICELNLEDCGKLQIDYHPTTLKRLYISGHNIQASLLERIGNIISDISLELLCIYSCSNMNIPMNCCYNFLTKLDIDGSCDSLTTFPLDFFPKLSYLELRCHNLQMISQGHTHNHLKYLVIGDCPQFESFPSEGLSAPRLETFCIEDLLNLKSLPKDMHILLSSLTSLSIYNCPEVELFSYGGLPSNLEKMNLSNCSKLITSLKGALGANTSLESLSIGEVDAVSFPDEGFLPLSLNSLTIRGCPHLERLDYKGLCQLSSLENLKLVDCPSLQCLPEEGLPKSISFLDIVVCPLLKQCCQKPESKDWEKIAHIKCIFVDHHKLIYQ